MKTSDASQSEKVSAAATATAAEGLAEAARTLTPEAERALAEAEARRRAQQDAATQRPAEFGGAGGPDPVRYGDWEKGGIASDF